MNKSMYEVDTHQFMKGLAETLNGKLNPGEKNKWGFMILIFPFEEAGVSNYISNAKREDMIKALREKVDVLEQKLDIVVDTDKES